MGLMKNGLLLQIGGNSVSLKTTSHRGFESQPAFFSSHYVKLILPAFNCLKYKLSKPKTEAL